MDKGDMHKPVVENYQPSDREFAGQQSGGTTDYIANRDRIQDKMASQVRKQEYHGRYM